MLAVDVAVRLTVAVTSIPVVADLSICVWEEGGGGSGIESDRVGTSAVQGVVQLAYTLRDEPLAVLPRMGDAAEEEVEASAGR